MITSPRALFLASALVALTAAADTPPPAKTPAVAPAAAAPAENLDLLPLATVNEHPITVLDITTTFNKRHAGHAKFLGGEVEARKFLYIVIDDRLLVEEAYELGIGESSEARKYVDEYARVQGSKYFVAHYITGAVKVTPEEVKAIWETYLNKYVHARHIVLATRAEAEEVREALLRGADFEALARACSLSNSRRRGGNLMVGWGQYGEEWERVVFGLQAGEISPVIEFGGLFEVVQLYDIVEVQRAELETVSKKIEEALYARKLEQKKVEIAADLRMKYAVEVRASDSSAPLLLKLLESAPDTGVATWNGGSLRLREVFDEAELRAIASKDEGAARKAAKDEVAQTLNSLLVDLEVKALRIEEVPEVAVDIQRYRDYVVESILFRDHIFRDIAVKDEELEKFYTEQKHTFAQPAQRRVAQIMVPTEAEAVKVRKEVVAPGANFGDLAKKYSRDMVSGAAEGDLGWVDVGKVPSGFEEVLKLKIGAVSKSIKSASGWHLIKVLEEKPQTVPPFAEIREKVKEQALEAKKKVARNSWIEKIRAVSNVKIHDAAIAAFVKANESVGPPPQHVMQ